MHLFQKEYALDDFSVNEHLCKPIKADGSWSHYSGKYEINDSSILTRLIQEAGRYCERFASDLWIDWKSVVDWIADADQGCHCIVLFGFLENGVDGNTFILSRFNDGGYCCPEKEYRSLWRLDMYTDMFGGIEMKLGRVF